jgi:hypothetical protein
MATLLLTALGTAIGGPIGGSIGAFIGQQADAMIFGGGTRQGTRLRELAVSTSSYGQPIGRHFGRMRVPGTIIWSTGLIENKRKQKGRKGQPSTVVYSYSASFAVALSSTPVARLGRIWADGNLLRGTLDDLKVAGKLRFYQGHGSDPVDPLIAADKGSNAPAFRDCAYVVFEELDLGDFGNRIPALSFEIFADGGEAAVSLSRLIPDAETNPADTITHARGFADEGGALGNTLAAIDEVIPLVCTSGRERLRITPRTIEENAIQTLPEALAADGGSGEERRHKQRAGVPARLPAAVRYYDEDRDYQPGVQRALGSRRYGRELMVDLPVTLTANGARQLANDRANRARWQSETVVWRVGQMDPRLQPGAVVRLPETAGLWFVRSWEWSDQGIELVLDRLTPNQTAFHPSDPGQSNPPIDKIIPKTTLCALEVPADGSKGPATSALYAAVSAENDAWRGAALYSVQANGLVALGSSGSQRAVFGSLVEPLGPSPGLLFEQEASMLVELVGDDLGFEDSDLAALAEGANRVMVGDEAVQFARAIPLGNRRWRLQGLLRGRGGTEPEAMRGHASQASIVLLDERLVALDPSEVPPLASTRIGAIGIRDEQPVIAALANPGLSRRPLTPVHPRCQFAPDGVAEWCWTRRARGQWRWEDSVDAPLVEEQEAYLVGYGSVAAPFAAWTVTAPRFRLAQQERNSLLTTFGPAPLWVRQVGTFDRSPALLLATIN